MGSKRTVDQESERALVAFLRARDNAPGHRLIMDHYTDALDTQAAWADVPDERARRNALALACRGLAAEWREDPEFKSVWMPRELGAAS